MQALQKAGKPHRGRNDPPRDNRGSPHHPQAPIVIAVEVKSPALGLRSARHDRLGSNRSHLPEASAPRQGLLPIRQRRCDSGTSVFAQTQWRQGDVPFLVKLQEKAPRGKVLQLAAGVTPLPKLAQLLGQTFTAPLRMGRNPFPQPGDLIAPETAPLNEKISRHSTLLPDASLVVQTKLPATLGCTGWLVSGSRGSGSWP